MTETLRSAVCVTGQARAFRFAAVRASLRLFLHQVHAIALRLDIARYSTCGMSIKPESCEEIKHAGLVLSEAELRAEFNVGPWSRQLSVTLFNESSCSNGRHDNHSCCRGPANRTTMTNAGEWTPGAFLQYAEFTQCARWLIDHVASATLIIRTRPDVLYLDLSASFSPARLANIRLPTMVCTEFCIRPAWRMHAQGRLLPRTFLNSGCIAAFLCWGARARHMRTCAARVLQIRKVQNGSEASEHLFYVHLPGTRPHAHSWYPKMAIEVHQPGDWFLVVPRFHAEAFFGDLLMSVEGSCLRGHWTQVTDLQSILNNARTIMLERYAWHSCRDKGHHASYSRAR